jgi:hypothetical protein
MTDLRAQVEALPGAPLDPCAELREAALAVCFSDLRDGFQDGDDIVLRWFGNIADWQRLRAALEEPTPQLLRDGPYDDWSKPEEPTPGPQYTEDDPDWSAMVSPISEDGGHDER